MLVAMLFALAARDVTRVLTRRAGFGKPLEILIL